MMNARLLSDSSATSPMTDSPTPAVTNQENDVVGRPITVNSSSVVSGLNTISSQRMRRSLPTMASVLVTHIAAMGRSMPGHCTWVGAPPRVCARFRPRDQIGHMQETTAFPAVACTNEQYPVTPQGFGVHVAAPVGSL